MLIYSPCNSDVDKKILARKHMRNDSCLVVLLLILSVISGCIGGDDSTPTLFEGDEPGECSDGADNDQDGLFDCNDPNCAGAAFCLEPVIDDDSDNQNETNNDEFPLGPIDLTNEMIDNGTLDNNDCAVVIITTGWDATSRLLMAWLSNFSNENSNFELYVANLQNEQGEDVLPAFEQFRGGKLVPEVVPSIAIISFEEYIITTWSSIQAALDDTDVVCTLNQRVSISEAFQAGGTGGIWDLYYTRINNATITPSNPLSHENPVCSAQWESNEDNGGEVIILYSWTLIWNESAHLDSNGNDPGSVWYSNFSESGIFDRNDTDLTINPNTGGPWTNVEIANQSISGKRLTCHAILVTQAFVSEFPELAFADIENGALSEMVSSETVEFQCTGDDSSCNGTDPADPEGGCGNITFTGCCSTDEDGNYTILIWCEGEVINTLNCSGDRPGCGWDGSSGYYNCVEALDAGTEDPSGENPCDCSELE